MIRKRGSHGWREIDAAAKGTIIDNIVAGRAPAGPLHLELDICDRCNVDCYFCNAMDVRTRDQVPPGKMASDGTFTTVADLTSPSPLYLTADRDDGVWFVQSSDQDSHSQMLIHPQSNGTSTRYYLPTRMLDRPAGGIAIDPSGDVWVALHTYTGAFIAKLVR